MIKIKAACGCLLQAGFTLKDRKLGEGEMLEFRTVLAGENGSVSIVRTMTEDGKGDSKNAHTTLSVDLSEYAVLPGLYGWELLLKRADGKYFCLLPADGNILQISRTLFAEDAV